MDRTASDLHLFTIVLFRRSTGSVVTIDLPAWTQEEALQMASQQMPNWIVQGCIGF